MEVSGTTARIRRRGGRGPATSTAAEILAAAPDGVFFSNGPGDPAAATYAMDAMRGVLDAGLPIFGICVRAKSGNA